MLKSQQPSGYIVLITEKRKYGQCAGQWIRIPFFADPDPSVLLTADLDPYEICLNKLLYEHELKKT